MSNDKSNAIHGQVGQRADGVRQIDQRVALEIKPIGESR